MLSFLLLAVITAATAFFMNKAGDFDKMQIDVYIANEGTMEQINSQTKLAAGMVSQMDSFQSVSRFVFKDTEEDARKDVETGKAAAAIVLTADFYDNINRGENTPLTILVSKANSLNNAVFKENVSSLVNVLQDAESAVYALDLAAVKYKYVESQVDVENRISTELLQKFFARGDLFDEENISVYGEASVSEFYMVSILIILISAVGTVFAALYSEEKKDTLVALRRAGIGRPWTGAVHILSMVTVIYIFSLIFSGAAFKVLEEMGESSQSFSLFKAAALFPAMIFFASVFHLIYTLVRKSRNSALIFIIVMSVQMICGGGVIPMAYLPKSLRIAGEFSAVRIAEKYMTGLFFGKINASNILILILASVAVFAAALAAEIIAGKLQMAEEERSDRLEDQKKNVYSGFELPYPARWIWVIIKRNISVPGILAMCIFTAGAIYIYSEAVLPSVSNKVIGVCSSDDNEYAESIFKEDTGFDYTRYTDEKTLREDVTSGKADCGFVISDNGENICFITSGSSTKGYVAKERIYSAVFGKIAENKVTELAHDNTVFTEAGDEAADDAIKAYRDFQNSEYVFTVNYKDIGNEVKNSEMSGGSSLGLLAAAIFILTLGFGRYRYTDEFKNISRKLPIRFSKLYLFGNILIPGLVMSEILVIMSAVFFGFTGLPDVLRAIPSVLLASVWGMIISGICVKDETYLCTMFSIFIVSLLVCSVFFDISEMLPMLKMIRILFPENIMLAG
ncbi:MAG: ABC transporter permease [Lachnospiraceae bacterium]|nr:ABC transporter permease [Lachnospiraceae bacterium]